MGGVQTAARVRFRHHAALAVAAVITLVAAVPLVAAAPLLTPILLIPIAVAAWAWRSGTDADGSGVRVRALFGQRRFGWPQVAAIAPVPGRRVVATLTDGHSVLLTAVTPADIPRLLAASGQPPPERQP